MTNSQIINMLEEIIQEADYDTYKRLFVEDYIVDPQVTQVIQEQLIAIVKQHQENTQPSGKRSLKMIQKKRLIQSLKNLSRDLGHRNLIVSKKTVGEAIEFLEDPLDKICNGCGEKCGDHLRFVKNKMQIAAEKKQLRRRFGVDIPGNGEEEMFSHIENPDWRKEFFAIDAKQEFIYFCQTCAVSPPWTKETS